MHHGNRIFTLQFPIILAAICIRVSARSQSTPTNRKYYRGIGLKRTYIQSESILWHLRVAEGDHLSERGERRKLPQQETRCPRYLTEIENVS